MGNLHPSVKLQPQAAPASERNRSSREFVFPPSWDRQVSEEEWEDFHIADDTKDDSIKLETATKQHNPNMPTATGEYSNKRGPRKRSSYPHRSRGLKCRSERHQNQLNPLTRAHFTPHHCGGTLITDLYIVDSAALTQRGRGFSRCTHRLTEQSFGLHTMAKKSQKALYAAQTEISIRRSIDHPSIVNMLETFEDAERIHWVVELCEGPDLMTTLVQRGSIPEPEACTIMRNIFSAVAYLHAHNITIRDIRPERFRFVEDNGTTGQLKLTGLPVARYAQQGTLFTTRAGTPYCVAPEVIRGIYTRRCDDWSCGIILFTLLFGCPPVFGDTDVEVLRNIRLGRMIRPVRAWKALSYEARSLITSMLNMNDKIRFTCREALSSDWMKLHSPVSCSRELAFHVVRNLEAFAHASRLKQAALIVLARYFHGAAIQELQLLFDLLDIEASGVLSIRTMIRELERLAACQFLARSKDQLICNSEHGTMHYIVFLAAAMDKSRYMHELKLMYLAFNSLDQDNDGYLTCEELCGASWLEGNALSMSIRSALAKQIVYDADVDGDGQVDFDEFVFMLKSDDLELSGYQSQQEHHAPGRSEGKMMCVDYLKRRQTLLRRAQRLERATRFAYTTPEVDQNPRTSARTKLVVSPLDRFRQFQAETLGTVREEEDLHTQLSRSDHDERSAIQRLQNQFSKWRFGENQFRGASSEQGSRQLSPVRHNPIRAT